MQIKQKLIKIIDSLPQSDIQLLLEGDDTTNAFSREGIACTQIEHYGGQFQGSEYYTIYSFKNHEEVLYVKFYGKYDWFYGLEYEGYMFVTPKAQTTTFYS